MVAAAARHSEQRGSKLGSGSLLPKPFISSLLGVVIWTWTRKAGPFLCELVLHELCKVRASSAGQRCSNSALTCEAAWCASC